MQLSPEDVAKKTRGLQAKAFIQSEFFGKYFHPLLQERISKDLPEPIGPDWEDKYRELWSNAHAVKEIMTLLQSWSHEADMLVKKEREEERSIEDA